MITCALLERRCGGAVSSMHWHNAIIVSEKFVSFVLKGVSGLFWVGE